MRSGVASGQNDTYPPSPCAEAFEKLRASGLQLDLVIVMHSEGRASIVLPPALLVACAPRELPVSVIAPE
jgi:hypothetical protein